MKTFDQPLGTCSRDQHRCLFLGPSSVPHRNGDQIAHLSNGDSLNTKQRLALYVLPGLICDTKPDGSGITSAVKMMKLEVLSSHFSVREGSVKVFLNS